MSVNMSDNKANNNSNDAGINNIINNEVNVVIAGKTLTIRGSESEEYLHMVADYINAKISEVNKMSVFRRQTTDMQIMMVELNLADDYFKAKNAADELEISLSEKNKELYDLKHELISTQVKLDAANKEIDRLKKNLK